MKWNIFSPLPKFSPSSNVIGIGLFVVSGKYRQQKAPIKHKPPRISDGNGVKKFA
jgi:hypothetical protein